VQENDIEPLSERELELVCLLAEGLSNKEIARELYISPNTVKVHLRNIYAKLRVSSRTEASMVALRMGWVDLDRPAEDSTELAEPSATEGPAIDRRSSAVTPLARWQQAYLIVAALLVGLGLWAVWPRTATPAAPSTDLRAPSPSWIPGQVSRWKQLAQMPVPRSRLGVVAYGERIYAIAGESANGVSDAVSVYLPPADDWVHGPDKPTAVANVQAVVLEARIYVPGGSLADGRMSDKVEVFDTETESWNAASALPRALCAYALAAYEGQLYLFGGWDGASSLAQSYRYDPASDTWEPLASMPSARAFAGAGSIGDYIYVVGGYDGQDELDICQAYDPHADTWHTCPAMNVPRGGLSTAVIADTLYVVGGGWNSYLVENEYFSPDTLDPTQGTWRTFPSPLLKEWRNLGLVANNTTLHAIGGWDGTYLSVNQAYRALYRLYLPSAMGQGGSAQE
jgi:DNA-binding CsgD family transcriptional regulator/N-acetylneuraminic acid mutarotase